MTASTIVLRDDSAVYEQFSYPAGEHQIRFRGRYASDSVTVIARIRNGDDVMKLALLRSSLEHLPDVRLILPYLPYSRADRRFTDGDCFGLEAFGALINSMAFHGVVTLDAHNPHAAHACVNRLKDVSPARFMEQAIVDFAQRHKSRRITVLFPDEGARERYDSSLPQGIECNTAKVRIVIAHCRKIRSAVTGKLEGFEVPPVESDYPAIVVDDICDGGLTFAGIAQRLNLLKLGLYVTHGIFSKGPEPLLRYFEHLYTTNSFLRVGSPPRITVFDALPEMML